MKSKKIIYILSLVAISGVTFWSGTQITRYESYEHSIDDNSFKKGVSLERGHQSWMHASNSQMYLSILNSNNDNKLSTLRDCAILDMWLSIIELNKFVHNEDATKENRKAASRILAQVVDHFRRHPKKIEKPENTNLAASFRENVETKKNSEAMDSQTKEIFTKVRELAKEPIIELEGMFDGIINQIYKRDIETQKIINLRIKSGDYGDKITVDGVYFWLPEGRGRTSRNQYRLKYRGDGITISYKTGDQLIVNDRDYGKLEREDKVEFRDNGVVLVNNIERSPKKQNKK